MKPGRMNTWFDAMGVEQTGSNSEFLNFVKSLSLEPNQTVEDASELSTITLPPLTEDIDAEVAPVEVLEVNGEHAKRVHSEEGEKVFDYCAGKNDVTEHESNDDTNVKDVNNDDTINMDSKNNKDDATDIINVANQLDDTNHNDNIIVEQTSTSVTPMAKVSEWVAQTEFADATASNGANGRQPADEDRMLNDLLDQVAELDDIYEDHQLRRGSNATPYVADELNCLEGCLQSATAQDDSGEFDDAATYSSLQIAFKNPISIMNTTPVMPPPVMRNSEARCLVNPAGPLIAVGKRPEPVLSKPDLVDEDIKLPPLPPKRGRKLQMSSEDLRPINNGSRAAFVAGGGGGHETFIGNSTTALDESRTFSQSATNSRRSSSRSLQRPQSQIIIMKSPNSQPTPKPMSTSTSPSINGSCATLPRQKKQGFFAKLFSRRKSKSDLASKYASQPNMQSNADGDDDDDAGFGNAGAKSSVTDQRSSSTVRNVALKGPASTASADASTMTTSRASKSTLQTPGNGSRRTAAKPVGRSVSSVSGKRPHLTADIVHIPLKGCDSSDAINADGVAVGDNLAGRHGRDDFERASTATLSNNLDRKTVSALQLADLPFQDGGMELIAIADRQSLKNLCESQLGIVLDPSVDLTEAEHYALYTSVAPHATESEFDEASAYYSPIEAGEILTQDEVARRLAGGFS